MSSSDEEEAMRFGQIRWEPEDDAFEQTERRCLKTCIGECIEGIAEKKVRNRDTMENG